MLGLTAAQRPAGGRSGGRLPELLWIVEVGGSDGRGAAVRVVEALLAVADEVWQTTGPADWEEAFAHHPRIGERERRGREPHRECRVRRRASAAASSDADRGRRSPPRARSTSGASAESSSSARAAGAPRRSSRTSVPEWTTRPAGAEDRHGGAGKITRLRLGKLIGAESDDPDHDPRARHRNRPARRRHHGAAGARRRRARRCRGGRGDGRERRVRDWVPGGTRGGRYRLVFETGAWFRASGRESLYPEVVIDFVSDDRYCTTTCRCCWRRTAIPPTAGAEACPRDSSGTATAKRRCDWSRWTAPARGHELHDLTVDVQLQGGFETAHVEGDNARSSRPTP